MFVLIKDSGIKNITEKFHMINVFLWENPPIIWSNDAWP